MNHFSHLRHDQHSKTMSKLIAGALVKVIKGTYAGQTGRILAPNDVCSLVTDGSLTTLDIPVGAMLMMPMNCIEALDWTTPPSKKFFGDNVIHLRSFIFAEMESAAEKKFELQWIDTLGKLYDIINKAYTRQWQYKREWQIVFWDIFVDAFAPKPVQCKRPKSARKLGRNAKLNKESCGCKDP